MNELKKVLIICFSFFYNVQEAQISFVMTSSLCAGDSVHVLANTNSFPAASYSWVSVPAGPIFSSGTSSASTITFPLSGTYVITLMANAGNVTAYASNSILVQAIPQMTVTSSNATICPGQTATLVASGASTYTWIPTPGLIVGFGGMAQAAPGATSVYSVSGTNTAGCKSDITFKLEFGSFPNLVLVPGSPSLCAGFSTSINAFGANAYTWTSVSFSTAIFTGSISCGAGTYSVLGSNGGSCTDSTSITIGLSPPLNLIISANRNIICKDGGDSLVPINLVASGATTYEWEPYYPGYMTYSMGPTTSVSPTITTCYTLTGSTALCSSKTSLCVRVDTCTGIYERDHKKNYALYPNPVKDILTFRADRQEMYCFELTDLFGNCLIKKKLDLTSSYMDTINMEEITQGFYLVKISANNGVLSIERILKE